MDRDNHSTRDPARADPAPAGARRPYRPPCLAVLGTLEQLTASGAGNKWEGHPVFPSSAPR